VLFAGVGVFLGGRLQSEHKSRRVADNGGRCVHGLAGKDPEAVTGRRGDHQATVTNFFVCRQQGSQTATVPIGPETIRKKKKEKKKKRKSTRSVPTGISVSSNKYVQPKYLNFNRGVRCCTASVSM
jgi:hypothetical protein